MTLKFILTQLVAVCAGYSISTSHGTDITPSTVTIAQPTNRISQGKELLRYDQLLKRQIPVDTVLQQAGMASRAIPTIAALQQPNLWGIWKAPIPPIPIIPAEMMPVNYPQPLALQMPVPPEKKRPPKLPMPTAIDYIMLNVYITSKLEELQMRVLRIENKLEKLEQPAFLSWPDGR
uniref:Uncharacterized protein n=1 Tax=Trichuris muris TaxID=70415 RepID=A0A5S6QU92_TRIMR